jgi:hypothetical protein
MNLIQRISGKACEPSPLMGRHHKKPTFFFWPSKRRLTDPHVGELLLLRVSGGRFFQDFLGAVSIFEAASILLLAVLFSVFLDHGWHTPTALGRTFSDLFGHNMSHNW